MPHQWLRVTGSDYAGFYQEQLLYRCASLLGTEAHALPMIIYAPLILDWSGAKLSKSLYVREGAYDYLPKYVLSFDAFKDAFGESGVEKLFEETSRWIDKPHNLFRNYSVDYFVRLFEGGSSDNNKPKT